MSRYRVLLLALVFLSGCESLNGLVVRQMFKDSSLGRRVGDQIRDGLERREKAPLEPQKEPAPPFLDQG